MNLFLLAGNSGEKIGEIIDKSFDSVNVSIYNNVYKFVESVSSRTTYIDRIIIVQDLLVGDSAMEDKLTSLNDFLNKYYPAVRVVSILKPSDKATIDIFSKVFISPYSVNLVLERTNASMLSSFVSDDIETLKRKYKTVASNEIGIESVEEVQAKPLEKKKGKGVLSWWGKGKEEKKGLKQIGFSEQSVKPTDIADKIEEIEEDDTEELATIETGGIVQSEEYHETIETKDEEGTTYLSEFEDDMDDFEGFEEFDGDETENKDTIIEESADIKENEFIDEDEADLDWVSNFGDDFNAETEESKSEDKSSNVEDVLNNGVEEDINDTFILDKNVGTTFTEEDLDILTSTGDEDKFSEPEEVLEEAKSFDILDFNIAKMAEDYERSIRPERVVEVEKVIRIDSGKKAYRNGIRIIIVTGDRRSGVTRTALNLASLYGKEARTLFVDYDTERKGSLFYIGLDEIIDESEPVQNGLAFLQSSNVLKHAVFNYTRGMFDCLLSSFENDVKDEQKVNVQQILLSQRLYSTVVIDCPIENLKFMKDIIIYSEVVICTESNLTGVVNTIGEFSKFKDNDSFASFIFNNGQYLVSKGTNEDLKDSLEYVKGVFSLDESKFDWSEIPILGHMKDIASLVKTL
ncbi:hypothetical protein D3C81_10300 [compost metagenome]